MMHQDEFKSILTGLLLRCSVASSLKSQIKISTNKVNKTLCLSIPIFVPFGRLPAVISDYVSKRISHSFKPHATRFERQGEEVHLIQEIPFHWEPHESLRSHVANFWSLSLRCHTMLKEIAFEEKNKKLASLDHL